MTGFYGCMFGSNWTFLLIFFHLTFGHHVKFKCAQGRKIIVPVATYNAVENVVNILLTSPARLGAKMIRVARNHFKQPCSDHCWNFLWLSCCQNTTEGDLMRGCLLVWVVFQQQRVSKTTTVATFIFGDHNINTAYQTFLKKMRTVAAMFAWVSQWIP